MTSLFSGHGTALSGISADTNDEDSDESTQEPDLIRQREIIRLVSESPHQEYLTSTEGIRVVNNWRRNFRNVAADAREHNLITLATLGLQPPREDALPPHSVAPTTFRQMLGTFDQACAAIDASLDGVEPAADSELVASLRTVREQAAQLCRHFAALDRRPLLGGELSDEWKSILASCCSQASILLGKTQGEGARWLILDAALCYLELLHRDLMKFLDELASQQVIEFDKALAAAGNNHEGGHRQAARTQASILSNTGDDSVLQGLVADLRKCTPDGCSDLAKARLARLPAVVRPLLLKDHRELLDTILSVEDNLSAISQDEVEWLGKAIAALAPACSEASYPTLTGADARKQRDTALDDANDLVSDLLGLGANAGSPLSVQARQGLRRLTGGTAMDAAAAMALAMRDTDSTTWDFSTVLALMSLTIRPDAEDDTLLLRTALAQLLKTCDPRAHDLLGKHDGDLEAGAPVGNRVTNAESHGRAVACVALLLHNHRHEAEYTAASIEAALAAAMRAAPSEAGAECADIAQRATTFKTTLQRADEVEQTLLQLWRRDLADRQKTDDVRGSFQLMNLRWDESGRVTAAGMRGDVRAFLIDARLQSQALIDVPGLANRMDTVIREASTRAQPGTVSPITAPSATPFAKRVQAALSHCEALVAAHARLDGTSNRGEAKAARTAIVRGWNAIVGASV